MSKPTLEVYEAVAKLNQQSLMRAIAEGDTALMARSLKRLNHALEEIDQYKKENESE